MNIWHRADPSRITPSNFLACIEISKGSKNKYELDKYSGALILDRVLYTSTHYPHNYGFIPRTYAGDGDPLDVLVLCSEPIVPLALVECFPIGMLEMTDSGEVPDHILKEIQHFFKVYKELEGKETVVDQIHGKAIAVEVIEACIKAYEKKFPNKNYDYKVKQN